MKTEFITIESEAFYRLLNDIHEFLQSKIEKPEPVWLTASQVKSMLGVKDSTLSRLRNEGCIVYSQISKKQILYKASSIHEYLESKIVNY